MRHWTLEDIKLPRSPAQLRAPMPFPGRYPTRIAFLCPKKGSYIGKPSADQVRRFLRLTGCPPEGQEAVTISCEFDRGGLIWLRGQRHWGNPELFCCYHPWSRTYAGLRMFLQPYFAKTVSGQRLYSPVPHLRLEQVEEYKTFYVDFQHKLNNAPLPHTPVFDGFVSNVTVLNTTTTPATINWTAATPPWRRTRAGNS